MLATHIFMLIAGGGGGSGSGTATGYDANGNGVIDVNEQLLSAPTQALTNLDTFGEWWKVLLVTLLLYAGVLLWGNRFRDDNRRWVANLLVILGAAVFSLMPIIGDLGLIVFKAVESATSAVGANITVGVIGLLLALLAWALHRRKKSFLTFLVLSIALSFLAATEFGRTILNGWGAFCIGAYDVVYNVMERLFQVRLHASGL